MNDYYIEKVVRDRCQTEKKICALIQLRKSAPVSDNQFTRLIREQIEKILNFMTHCTKTSGTLLKRLRSCKQILPGGVR